MLNKSSEYRHFWFSGPCSLLLRTKVMAHTQVVLGHRSQAGSLCYALPFPAEFTVVNGSFMLVSPTGLRGAGGQGPHLSSSMLYS